MTGALSARDRRVLVLGGVAVALILLLGRGLPAWRRWDADAHARAGRQVMAAARAEAAANQLPAALDSLQARQRRFVALGGELLEGRSPAAAGADLAGLVSSAAARAGVQLGSVQVRPDTASAGTLLRVNVRADATGDLPSITRMLGLLEGAGTRLAIRELSITQPNAGGPAEQAEALRLEISVQGMALAPGARGPAGAPARDTTRADSLDALTVDTDTLDAPEGALP